MTPATISIAIEVAPFPPALAGPVGLRLPAGATIADALAILGLDISEERRIGVWGCRATRAWRLVEGDRIEFYRPLTADPKSTRQRRAQKARSRR